MNCANHPETPAAAYCRDCGKPLCPECIRRARGSVFCAEHAPAPETPAEGPFIPQAGTAAGFAPLSPGAASFFAPPASISPYDAPAGSPYESLAAPAPRGADAALPVSPYMAPAARHSSGGVPPVIALLLGFIPGVGAICNGQYAKGLIHAVIFGLLVSAEASRIPGPAHALLGVVIAAWVFYMAFEAFHTAARRRRGLPVEEFSSLFEVHGVNNHLPLGAVLLVVVGFILLLDTTDIISMEVFARYWPAGLIALGVYLLYARVHPAPARPVEHDASHDLAGQDLEARQ